MSSLSMEQARREINGRFYEDWRAKTPALDGGQVSHVEWDGVAVKDPPSQGRPWARVRVSHLDGGQRSLGEEGSRTFERLGAVIVQVFAPGANGLTLADKLAKIAADSYEGRRTIGGVWFRDVRVREIGPANGWYQYNVTAEFVYDEVK